MIVYKNMYLSIHQNKYFDTPSELSVPIFMCNEHLNEKYRIKIIFDKTQICICFTYVTEKGQKST